MNFRKLLYATAYAQTAIALIFIVWILVMWVAS